MVRPKEITKVWLLSQNSNSSVCNRRYIYFLGVRTFWNQCSWNTVLIVRKLLVSSESEQRALSLWPCGMCETGHTLTWIPQFWYLSGGSQVCIHQIPPNTRPLFLFTLTLREWKMNAARSVLSTLNIILRLKGTLGNIYFPKPDTYIIDDKSESQRSDFPKEIQMDGNKARASS